MPETTAASAASVRSFHHSQFSPERIAAERSSSVSVVLPARECADTVAQVVSQLTPLLRSGAADELIVVDAASTDGTAEIAAEAGARVVQESDLHADLGPVLGKGDAMWRSLSVAGGDVVCFLDADSHGDVAHYATGLLGAVICEEDVDFVKGHYRRPLALGDVHLPDGGARVNHLAARPALAVFYPELSGFRQPLAGEAAARRQVLEEIPFATGYGVEIAMLIDAWRKIGLDRMAQVDLDEHVNSHQAMAALSVMSQTVLATIAERLRRDGRLQIDTPLQVERPPLATLSPR